MKHLKKIFKFSSLFILSAFLLLFLQTFKNYQGDKIIYILFTALNIYLFFFCFRKKKNFFDLFFGLFLLLGFWIKFSINIGFLNSSFDGSIGAFSFTKEKFNQVLMVSIYGILGFILAGHLRDLLNFHYKNQKVIYFLNQELYVKYRNFFLIVLIFLVILLPVLNLYYSIYQKGIYSNNIHFLVQIFFKFVLFFGFTSLFSYILFCDFKVSNKITYTLLALAILENFFSSVSILSRGMIFNSSVLIIGSYSLLRLNKIQIDLKYFFSIIIFSISLFYISLFIVEKLRNNFYINNDVSEKLFFNNSKILNKVKYYDKNNNIIEPVRTSVNSAILYLMVNRWVGIDGVMSVVQKNKILDYKILKNAFNIKSDPDDFSYHEKIFDIKKKFHQDELNKNRKSLRKGNTLPGIIAFLFYSGSYFIVFFSMFFISLFSSFIEFVSYKLTRGNIIFSCFIGHIIAYRLIHFGFAPYNTHYFVLSIIILLLFYYLITIYLERKN